MKNKDLTLWNLWFSFIELMVWISISMLLMFSVSIFVQNWIKNLASQKSHLENDIKIKDFTKNIFETLSKIDNNFQVTNLASWVIIKIDKNFDKWWFSYIWEIKTDNYYCETWSENHVIIKNFMAFEWIGWDFFNWISFNSWWISTSFLSWTINNLTWILLWPTDVAFWNLNTAYVSDTLGHSIYEFDRTDIANTMKKIVWNEVFWDDFIDWSNWTWVYLNSPTWLSYNNIWWVNYLFISDTLNDRILYLNTSNYKIYRLLTREDSLKEPTWIYYDDAKKTLFLANSWKKEILAYSSNSIFTNEAKIVFTPRKSVNFINRLEFTFFYSSWTTNPTLLSPSLTWNIIFTPNLKNEDFLNRTSNKLTYYFVNYSWGSIPDPLCTLPSKYIIWTSWNPIHCITNWTWITSSNQNKTFIWWTTYNIDIDNISWFSFLHTWSYYIKTDLLNWINIRQSFYSDYFSKWDNNIFTKDDNVLKVITWSIWYPSWLYWKINNLIYNDFLNRENVEMTESWIFVASTNLTNFSFDNLASNKLTDSILFPPIKTQNIHYDFWSDILNIYINYYKNYGCFWDENTNSLKEFILKKNIK